MAGKIKNILFFMLTIFFLFPNPTFVMGFPSGAPMSFPEPSQEDIDKMLQELEKIFGDFF